MHRLLFISDDLDDSINIVSVMKALKLHLLIWTDVMVSFVLKSHTCFTYTRTQTHKHTLANGLYVYRFALRRTQYGRLALTHWHRTTIVRIQHQLTCSYNTHTHIHLSLLDMIHVNFPQKQNIVIHKAALSIHSLLTYYSQNGNIQTIRFSALQKHKSFLVKQK